MAPMLCNGLFQDHYWSFSQLPYTEAFVFSLSVSPPGMSKLTNNHNLFCSGWRWIPCWRWGWGWGNRTSSSLTRRPYSLRRAKKLRFPSNFATVYDFKPRITQVIFFKTSPRREEMVSLAHTGRISFNIQQTGTVAITCFTKKLEFEEC